MNVQNRLYRFGSIVAVAAMLIAMAPMPQPASPSPSLDLPTDLFFSEYVEGSSLNKAIEIYNGTSAAIDLAAGNYRVEVYFNGSSSVGTTIALSGVVAAGDVWVVADDGADPAILAVTDQTTTSNLWNGNDAVVLRKGDAVVDAFGQIGFDPGSEWGSGDVTTKDHTLRRKAEITAGDSNGGDVFDPSLEWNGFPEDTFDGLGCLSESCGGTEPPPEPGGPDVVINEIRIDQPSTDTDEYFELAGAPDASLDGLTYLVIGDGSGGSGVIENVTALDGYSIPASGYFVAAESTFTLGSADLTTGLNFENSDNVTHLLVFGFTGSNGDDLDTNDDGVLDSEPWTAVVDSVALLETVGSGDLVYSPTHVGPDGSFVPGQVYRCGDMWRIGPFDLSIGRDTPGAANDCSTGPAFGTCGGDATLIHAVQGAGPSSPMAGDPVVIEGVVVGDFQGGYPALGGFNLQEEDDQVDADPATSEGIFVYQGSSGPDVALGDVVRVRGTVSEHYGLTEVGSLTGLADCGPGGTATPAELSLPVNSVDDFEPFEGMSVIFPQPLVISEYFNFDRYGEIVLTGHRHLTPTAEFEPGSPEEAQAVQDYSLDSITLDDGRTNQNPDPAYHPDGAVFNLDHRFRGGDTVSDLKGVMSYDFGIYRIQPTEGGTYKVENPRPAAPDPVGGDIKVASFNVLNYFTTLDAGSNQCGPPGYEQDCRGANTLEELSRQRDKILAALEGIGADVFGLIEIQNDAGASVQDLVDHLNADMDPADAYEYIDTGYIGTDAIKVAIIYKPASVTPIGHFAILDSSVDPRFVDTKNRPALAQTFVSNDSGRMFTLAVNHLKSKGSDCNDLGDPDTGDGQGNCNLTRLAAAQALVDWLAADPTGTGSPYSLIMGDLNSYDHEDPIDAIKAGPDDAQGTADDYTDLVFDSLGEDAYSYVFDGQIGYLDSALANPGMHKAVTGTTIWHINADEPDILDYDTSYKAPAQQDLYQDNAYRSSDHDPVIVGLNDTELAPAVELLVQMVDTYADEGQITGNNTAKALLDHLDKAARFRDSGKEAAYWAQLQAFINQVQGKTPKFVTQDAADTLSAEAAALLGG